jgi:hypothetical protein
MNGKSFLFWFKFFRSSGFIICASSLVTTKCNPADKKLFFVFHLAQGSTRFCGFWTILRQFFSRKRFHQNGDEDQVKTSS